MSRISWPQCQKGVLRLFLFTTATIALEPIPGSAAELLSNPSGPQLLLLGIGVRLVTNASHCHIQKSLRVPVRIRSTLFYKTVCQTNKLCQKYDPKESYKNIIFIV